MTDQDQTRQRQESIRPLATVGRARGFITVWQQTRRGEKMRLRRGGMWTPMSQTPGWGRVATLAWLCKEANHNAARAPGPVPPQQQRRGRGRELSFLSHNHLYPLSDMGRARSRDTSHHPFPDPPLQIPNTWLWCLCGNMLNTPSSVLPSVNPSGLQSHKSITSSESAESGYEADSD